MNALSYLFLTLFKPGTRAYLRSRLFKGCRLCYVSSYILTTGGMRGNDRYVLAGWGNIYVGKGKEGRNTVELDWEKTADIGCEKGTTEIRSDRRSFGERLIK